ncbi:MAG: hypothetical protein ABSH20_05910 [Tepidisphaeraceae bacterium]|jgi:Tfp pilus assembly protein PilV
MRHRRGFTLIEAALVTIIVGTGVVAVMQLLAAGSMSCRQSQDLTTAVHLANQIHELSLGLAFSNTVNPAVWGPTAGQTLANYDNVTDLDGQTYSPPIDARRQTLTNLSGWSQSITVNSVDPARITVTVPKGSTRAEQLTVNVSRNGQLVFTESWLTFDATP